MTAQILATATALVADDLSAFGKDPWWLILVKAVPDDDPPVSDLLERALLTVLGSLTRPRSSVEAPGGPGA